MVGGREGRARKKDLTIRMVETSPRLIYYIELY